MRLGRLLLGPRCGPHCRRAKVTAHGAGASARSGPDGTQLAECHPTGAHPGVHLRAAVCTRQRLGGGDTDVQRRLRLGRRQDRPDTEPVFAVGRSARPGGGPPLHGHRARRDGHRPDRALVVRHHPAGARRVTGGDAAGASESRTVGPAGDLRGQGRHVRLDVGLSAGPVGRVGRVVEPSGGGLRLGLFGLGYVCVPVVVRPVRGADDVGGAPAAQAETRWPPADRSQSG